ncbi:MAG: hypothetical protein EON48_09935, partial [Acetobacteraceae bacterium]
MRFPSALAALGLAAVVASLTPVHADPAADFQRLTQTFPSLNFVYSPEPQVAQAKAFVAAMTGKWAEIGPLLGDGKVFPEPDILTKACEKVGFTATPVGSYGFDLEMAGAIRPFVIHLQWAGGMTYASQYDEAGMLARLFGDKADEMSPDILYSALTRS